MARFARFVRLPMMSRWALCCLMAVFLLAGCARGSDANDSPPGQISRPADIGLPLDTQASTEAFDIVDRFLVKWFFLEDVDAAMTLVHPNFADSWRPLVADTEVKRQCSFVQIEGSTPDASGVVTARYAIGGCNVIAPGGLSAVYIQITTTSTESGPRVIQIEFLR